MKRKIKSSLQTVTGTSCHILCQQARRAFLCHCWRSLIVSYFWDNCRTSKNATFTIVSISMTPLKKKQHPLFHPIMMSALSLSQKTLFSLHYSTANSYPSMACHTITHCLMFMHTGTRVHQTTYLREHAWIEEDSKKIISNTPSSECTKGIQRTFQSGPFRPL